MADDRPRLPHPSCGSRSSYLRRDIYGDITDEIALNLQAIRDLSDHRVVSIIEHEMSHVWQGHYGTPTRSGYHNAEWAAKMSQIGLVPSATGQPGGATTGQKMDHFIEPGGKFDVACAELLALGWKLPYADTAPDAKPKKTPSNGANVVWLYPSCGRKSWGSPTIRPICGYCIEAMEGTATNDALAVDNDWQRYLGPALAVARDKIGALLDDNVSDAEVDGAEDEAVDDEGEVEGDEMEGVKVVAVPIPPVDQVAELRAELRAERTAHAVTKKLLAVANATIQQLRPKLN